MNNIVFKRGYIWNNLPNNSIAIDGSYPGPLIDNENRIYSFDHHQNCIRHITKASCVQIMEALILGFEVNNYTIYVNDLDEDSLISVSLLIYPEILNNKNIIDFIYKIGKLDEHGPSFLLDEDFYKKYYSMKKIVLNDFNKKENSKYTEKEIEDIFLNSIEKFRKWVFDDLKIIDIPINEKIDLNIYPDTNNSKWIMIKSENNNIFSEAYKLGFSSIIVWDILDNNSYSYTIAKRSEFVDFPIKDLLEYLNSLEKGWGGGTTIGGAPRNRDGTRSFISPEELVNIVNKFLNNL